MPGNIAYSVTKAALDALTLTLSAELADRGITVVPEIDLPGHMQAAITAYPELGNHPDQQLKVRQVWGISDDVLNVNDETVEFVKTVLRHGWTVIIVVELTIHWHAIVQTHDHSLAEGMQFLNGEYSKTFNERHIRVGYLVRDRYWSRRKSTEAALINAYCYAANNPVLAGLVRRADEWRWGSYATTLGLGDAFSFVDARLVLAHFGSTTEQARAALRQRIDALAGVLAEAP